MKNRILYISEKEAEKLKKSISGDDGIFLVEADGAEIQSEEDYVREMEIKFQVPYGLPLKLLLDWYVDDITRCAGIEENKIIILIHHFDSMLVNAPKIKQRIHDDFNEIILPWWEGEIVGHQVGGEPKEFLVYLETG